MVHACFCCSLIYRNIHSRLYPPENYNVEVTDVVLNIKQASILKGGTILLHAVVKPSNATDPIIEWQSADESIATVDNEGLVEGLKVGKTQIIARSSGFAAECAIEVTEVPVEAIALDTDVLDLDLGDVGKLTATVTPQQADYLTVTWTSSNPDVATVDSQGNILTSGSGETLVKAVLGQFKDSAYVRVMGEPNIGDYYYSNGRYYSSPITGETPIAIIFYVGNPSADDKALQRDHPECVNGLAVSLFYEQTKTFQGGASKFGKLISDWAAENSEASRYILPYQSSSGEYLNSIMGYNNTKVFELFNADPANIEWEIGFLSALDELWEECPLPECTSDWYIPSAKELSLLLNSKIIRIPKAFLFYRNFYYSSTESDIVKTTYSTTYNSWQIKMATGYIFSQAKNQGQAVRPVFAF